MTRMICRVGLLGLACSMLAGTAFAEGAPKVKVGEPHSWSAKGVHFTATRSVDASGKVRWQRTAGKGDVARVTGNALPRTFGALLYEHQGGGDVTAAIRALAGHAADKQQFVQMKWNDAHVVEVAPAAKGDARQQAINAQAAERAFFRAHAPSR